MSLDEKPGNPADAEELRRRRERFEEIVAGSLPSTDERLAGYPACKGSENEDRRLFVRSLLVKQKDKLSKADEVLLELAESDGSIETLLAARELALTIDDRGSARRFQLYAALAGDTASAWPLGGLLASFRSWRFSVDGVNRLALGLGLLRVRGGAREDLPAEALVSDGLDELRCFGEWSARLDGANDVLDNQQDDTPAQAAEDQVKVEHEASALAQQVLKEASEAKGKAQPEEARPTLLVVPAYATDDKKRASAARDVAKSFESIAGKPLPLVGLGDPSAIRALVEPRFPHFAAELDIILRQRLPWKLLLVGDPGSGKTELARSLTDAMGLPFLVYSCAGSSDGAFAGTSAQWATARASIPLQVIHRSRTANPLVLLDEIDKADPDRRNGALGDALLNFLEPASARRVMDLGLELEVDVSAVSYVATANTLAGVPVPLRDRFKVVRMPAPGLEHLDHFVHTIFDDIAGARGIDRRWLAALAQDETELVRQAWRGGSLRKLRRILELLIDGRDKLWGRA